MLGWADDGKVGLLAAVTDDLVKKAARRQAGRPGGQGGRRQAAAASQLAQAGGKEPGRLGRALELARRLVEEQLGK